MQIIYYSLTGTNRQTLKTEVLYAIASAKSQKADLLCLTLHAFNGIISQTRLDAVVRELRGAKKGGQIQFYIESAALSEESTETEYLKNKFPEIFSMEIGEGSIIVKL